jgi:hypothetical protein
MTTAEYSKRYTDIAASEADPTVKAEALAKLDMQYKGIYFKAMQVINDSAPDPIKGDN